MPWSQVSPMDQRLQFVAEYRTGLYSMTELAAAYGVSRRIGHRWVTLYEREGPARLAGASRRPHTSPTATPAAIVERVLTARRAHPTWGAGKLRAWLVRQAPGTTWPCRDTCHEICRRAGLVRLRLRRRAAVHPPVQLTTATRPNQLWTADYKVNSAPVTARSAIPLRCGMPPVAMSCAARPSRPTPAPSPSTNSSTPSVPLACPIAFAATTGLPLPLPASGASPASPSGGFASASTPNGLPRGIRNRTGRMSNSMRSSSAKPRGHPPPLAADNSAGLRRSSPNTTRNGLTTPSAATRRPHTTRPRPARTPSSSRRSTIPPPGRCAA